METTTEVRAAEWQQWQHRRTVVWAIQYDGTEAGRYVIADRVNREQPDHAIIREDGMLLVLKQQGWALVAPGSWVGIGYHGHLWVITHEVFVGCYDPAGGPDHSAVIDRNTAAAMVVSADELVERAETDGAVDVVGMLAEVRVYVHQLATSLEALR